MTIGGFASESPAKKHMNNTTNIRYRALTDSVAYGVPSVDGFKSSKHCEFEKTFRILSVLMGSESSIFAVSAPS